jgi:hypothetical protein
MRRIGTCHHGRLRNRGWRNDLSACRTNFRYRFLILPAGLTRSARVGGANILPMDPAGKGNPEIHMPLAFRHAAC